MSKHIIITGATGFIGETLCGELAGAGYEVVALSRSDRSRDVGKERITFTRWDAVSTEGWGKLADGALAIVNLAGDNIGSGLWTNDKKKRILDSRLDAGKAVVEAVRDAANKPEVIIQASAIGYYGSRGDEPLDESSAHGSGFLSEVTRKWEESTKSAVSYGTRHVIIRIGVVLGGNGGVLQRAMFPFRIYLGGHFGSGRGWFSWIHVEDAAKAIRFLIENSNLSGIFNLTSYQSLSSKDFFKTIGKVMRKPSWLHAPAFMLRLLIGEMADELLLSSQRVIPKRLLEAGFKFKYPTAESALKEILKNRYRD